VNRRVLARLGIALAYCGVTLARADPPQQVQAEVNHLLAYVATSGCAFIRNGAHYDGQRAEAHLRDKYLALVADGRIQTAEDFVAKAASRSNLTGRPYEVRCAAAAPQPSATWLLEELLRFRNRSSPDKG
jgi:hypothetical protein